MQDIHDKYRPGEHLNIKDIEDLRRYSEITKNLTTALEIDFREKV